MLLQTGYVAGAPACERVRAGAADPAGRLFWEDCPQCLPWWIGPNDPEGMATVRMTQSYTFSTTLLAHTAGKSTGWLQASTVRPRVWGLSALRSYLPSVGSVSLCACGLYSHQTPGKKDSC